MTAVVLAPLYCVARSETVHAGPIRPEAAYKQTEWLGPGRRAAV